MALPYAELSLAMSTPSTHSVQLKHLTKAVRAAQGSTADAFAVGRFLWRRPGELYLVALPHRLEVLDRLR